ncbi:MAG: hypothetical protein ACWA5T_05455 [Parvularcula sp.]
MGHPLPRRGASVLALAAAVPIFVSSAGASPIEAIRACRSIEGTEARLACYDNLAASLEAVTATKATPMQAIAQPLAANQKTKPTAEQLAAIKQQMRMGTLDLAALDPEVTVLQRRDNGLVNKIEVRIIRIESLGNGRIRFVTADGQEWTQIESKSVRLPRDFPSGGIRAEIRTAALGSFFLKLDTSNRSVRVRPIR